MGNGNWYPKIPPDMLADPRIGHAEFRILCAILMHCDADGGGECTASNATLAKESATGGHHATRAIGSLITKGIISSRLACEKGRGWVRRIELLPVYRWTPQTVVSPLLGGIPPLGGTHSERQYPPAEQGDIPLQGGEDTPKHAGRYPPTGANNQPHTSPLTSPLPSPSLEVSGVPEVRSSSGPQSRVPSPLPREVYPGAGDSPGGQGDLLAAGDGEGHGPGGGDRAAAQPTDADRQDAAGDGTDRVPWGELLTRWNALAADSPNMVAAKGWTDERKGHARARLNGSDPLAAWGEMLGEVGKSSFLRRGTDGRAWKFKLDWALKPSSWQKIVEGSYRDEIEEATPPPRPTPAPRPEIVRTPEQEAEISRKLDALRRRLAGGL